MKAVIISSNYRITIPPDIREQFNLKPGQKVVFIPEKHSIRLEIVRPIKEVRGMFKGMNTENIREEVDEVR